LGIQASATAVLLNHRYGMSKRKISALLQDWGLPIRMDDLIQLQHRLAHHLAEQYQALIQRAKASSVLYYDETTGPPGGWYLGSQRAGYGDLPTRILRFIKWKKAGQEKWWKR